MVSTLQHLNRKYGGPLSNVACFGFKCKLRHYIKEQRAATERAQKEYNGLNEKVQKLHRDLVGRCRLTPG